MNLEELRTLVNYHYWARDRLLDGVAPLSHAQFTERIESSFPSVCDTLVHLCAAEAVWLDQQRRWDRPVGWSGEHELELRFGAPHELLREPLVLDLLLVDGGKDGDPDRCLRRRLGGPDAQDGFRRKSRASSGGGFGLMLIDPRPSDDPALTLLLDLALKELFTRYPDSPSTHWVDPDGDRPTTGRPSSVWSMIPAHRRAIRKGGRSGNASFRTPDSAA